MTRTSRAPSMSCHATPALSAGRLNSSRTLQPCARAVWQGATAWRDAGNPRNRGRWFHALQATAPSASARGQQDQGRLRWRRRRTASASPCSRNARRQSWRAPHPPPAHALRTHDRVVALIMSAASSASMRARRNFSRLDVFLSQQTSALPESQLQLSRCHSLSAHHDDTSDEAASCGEGALTNWPVAWSQ